MMIVPLVMLILSVVIVTKLYEKGSDQFRSSLIIWSFLAGVNLSTLVWLL